MDAIKPRKAAAMGLGYGSVGKGAAKGGGNFGIPPLSSAIRPLGHIDRTHIPRHLGNDERAARPPISQGSKKLANQANPDHGPHHATGACPYPK